MASEELRLPQIFFPGGPQFTVLPGTVCKIGREGLSLLLGRVRVEIPENGSPTAILGRLCRFEVVSGEALAQVDTDANSLFGLVRGEGWVRGAGRAEEVLTAGKGISVTRDGKPGKPGEIDPRLEEHVSLPSFGPTAWMRQPAPVPEPPRPAPASSSVVDEDAIASGTSAPETEMDSRVASDTASFSAMPEIVGEPGSPKR